MNLQILYKTNWISLRRIIDKELGINGYDYSHEDRCNGRIVAILPYRYSSLFRTPEYLLRKEITPCWDIKKSMISSITGGVEGNNTTRQTAIIEIAEEAGYEIENKQLNYLGECYGIKSSDTIYYLFTVDLTGFKKTLDGSGDGSELELKAKCYWTSDINDAVDPLVYVMYYKVHQLLKTEGGIK